MGYTLSLFSFLKVIQAKSAHPDYLIVFATSSLLCLFYLVHASQRDVCITSKLPSTALALNLDLNSTKWVFTLGCGG